MVRVRRAPGLDWAFIDLPHRVPYVRDSSRS
jgi:hypothetical protein